MTAIISTAINITLAGITTLFFKFNLIIVFVEQQSSYCNGHYNHYWYQIGIPLPFLNIAEPRGKQYCRDNILGNVKQKVSKFSLLFLFILRKYKFFFLTVQAFSKVFSSLRRCCVSKCENAFPLNSPPLSGEGSGMGSFFFIYTRRRGCGPPAE